MTTIEGTLDISTWLQRAIAVQQERGAVAVTACMDRGDVESCRSALNIAIAAKTIGSMLGMPASAARDMDTMIELLGSFVAMIDDPEQNWSDER